MYFLQAHKTNLPTTMLTIAYINEKDTREYLPHHTSTIAYKSSSVSQSRRAHGRKTLHLHKLRDTMRHSVIPVAIYRTRQTALSGFTTRVSCGGKVSSV